MTGLWRRHWNRSAHWLGAASLAAIAVSVPEMALAYHDSVGIGGGQTIHVFIVIAVVVAVMLVLLSRWQPRKPGRKRPGVSARSAGKKSRKRR